jgi:PhoH-like ATPase
MATTFVLDTSVLLSAGKAALYSFGANNVVLPLVVVIELEKKRNDPDLGLAARSVLRALDSLRSVGDLAEGVSLGEGYGSLRVETNHVHTRPHELVNRSDNDSLIISVAYNLGEEIDGVVLVSKDIPMKIMADIVGVETADFVPANISGEFIDDTEVIEVPSWIIDEVHANGTVKMDLDIPRNVGAILRSEENPKHTAMVIAGPNYSFNKVKSLKVSGLESRSAEQALAIDYLMDESVKIVSLGGRAGTGKTTLALAAGIEQLSNGIGKGYKKIIVFRSMHAVGGEEMGFLPGTEAEKFDPWVQAIYDSLGSFMTKDQIAKLKTRQAIEVLPLTHIRGRTFNNAFIIIDEAQNLERSTILTALSRLGKNSKAVMSWDVSQRDNFRVGRHDGVYEVTSRLLGERLFAHTSLKKSERSDVAELVSRVLDDFEI